VDRAAQLLLGIILVTMSLLDPRSALGMFSLLAGIGAFASATQDIAINAWRIDIADDEATIDILSTVYRWASALVPCWGRARPDHRRAGSAGRRPTLLLGLMLAGDRRGGAVRP
jgi:hypothetical protein